MARKSTRSRSASSTGNKSAGAGSRRRQSRVAQPMQEGEAGARKLATQARATMDRARKQLNAADKRVSGYIQRNPKKAAAMAAGIGAAVGAAIAAAMRARR